jgi:uncharacterized protein YxjI
MTIRITYNDDSTEEVDGVRWSHDDKWITITDASNRQVVQVSTSAVRRLERTD